MASSDDADDGSGARLCQRSMEDPAARDPQDRWEFGESEPAERIAGFIAANSPASGNASGKQREICTESSWYALLVGATLLLIASLAYRSRAAACHPKPRA
jgi:hypothetical protein